MVAVVFTTQGARSTQEDTHVFGDVDLSGLPIETQKRILAKTIAHIGNALLLNKNGEPCEEEDCIAEFSGSTIVATLGDAWASVGDSLLLLCTITPDNQVTLKLVNPLHIINRTELELMRLSVPDVKLSEYIQYNNLTEKGRGRFMGAAMTRALGNYYVHQFGMNHRPDIGSLSYNNTTDKAFVIAASDGLVNFKLPNEAQFQERYNLVEVKYQKTQRTENDYLNKIEQYDFIDQEKLQAQLELFKNAIQAKVYLGEISCTNISTALTETLSIHNNNDINTASDNIIFVVSPAGQGYIAIADGHAGSESTNYIKNSFSTILQMELQKELNKQQQFTQVLEQLETLSNTGTLKSVITRNITLRNTGNNSPTNFTSSGRSSPNTSSFKAGAGKN